MNFVYFQITKQTRVGRIIVILKAYNKLNKKMKDLLPTLKHFYLLSIYKVFSTGFENRKRSYIPDELLLFLDDRKKDYMRGGG